MCFPVLLPIPQSARAQDSVQARPSAYTRTHIAVGAGPFGLGGEVGTYLWSHLAVRASVSGLTLNRALTPDENAYMVAASLRGVIAAVDVHPIASSGYFVTGGYAMSRNSLRADVAPGGDVEINGQSYSPSEVGAMRISITMPRTAPYVGLGVSKSATAHRGFGIRWDMGLIVGRFTTTVTSPNASANARLAADLASSESSLREQVDRFPGLPVGSLLLSYSF